MEKTLLQDIYETHHQTKGRYGYLFCHGMRIPFLQKWIGQGKKVLDLGCRDGMLTQGFVEGNEVIGVDIDQNALDLCKKRLNIETRWVDINQEWPFEEASFDVIVACEIVEHLFFLHPFLKNVQKTLKKGGLFLGSVPNAFRMRNRLKFLRGIEYETDPTHVRQFSYSSLERTLQEHFQKVKIVPIKGKILPWMAVRESTPKSLGALFGRDLLWRSEKIE